VTWATLGAIPGGQLRPLTLGTGRFWSDCWGAARRELHEVELGFSRQLWWKRKPRKEAEEAADKKFYALVRAVAKVAEKHVGSDLTKREKAAEVREEVGPMVEQMPGIDVVALYEELLRRVLWQSRLTAEWLTNEMQRAAIARAVQDEEDIELLLMSM
jgi:hypothetical protein